MHEYDDVDLIAVWETVHVDLPAVVSALQGVIPLEEKA